MSQRDAASRRSSVIFVGKVEMQIFLLTTNKQHIHLSIGGLCGENCDCMFAAVFTSEMLRENW